MSRTARIASASSVLLLVILAVIMGVHIQSHLGRESLSAWGNYLAGAGTIGLGIAAWLAGRMAVTEYRERTKAEHIRWIGELFGRFYQERLYRRIRQRFDYDDLEDIAALLEKNKRPDAEFSPEERDLFDEFTDYLNFFEFVAYLIGSGQVASEDISQIFDYYLKRFREVKQESRVMEYLKEDGFENLRQLLLKYKPKVRAEQRHA